MYLGDGCISTAAKGVHRLRIFLDMRYPGIIDEWAAQCARSCPEVRARQSHVGGATARGHQPSRSPGRACFPQHGPGRSTSRPIVLPSWQQELIDRDPGR